MAVLMPLPKMRFFDADGNPLVGGKLETYVAGTSTPLATFTDAGGGTPNANPVVLDANGEANIWLTASSSYKFILKNASDVVQWTVDNVSPSGQFLAPGTGGVVRSINSKLSDVIAVADFSSANQAAEGAYDLGAHMIIKAGQSAKLVCNPTSGDNLQDMCNWASGPHYIAETGELYVEVANGLHDVSTYIEITEDRFLDIRGTAAPDELTITGFTITSLGSNLYSCNMTVSTPLPSQAVVNFAVGCQNVQGDNGAESVNGAHQILSIAGDRLSFTFTYRSLGVVPTSPTALDSTASLGLTPNTLVVPKCCIRANEAGWDGAAREGFIDALNGGRVALTNIGISYNGATGDNDILFAAGSGSYINLADKVVIAGAGEMVTRSANFGEIYTNRSYLGGGTTGTQIWQGSSGGSCSFTRTMMGSCSGTGITASNGANGTGTQCVIVGCNIGLRTTFADATLSFPTTRVLHCVSGVTATRGNISLDSNCVVRLNTTALTLAGGNIYGNPLTVLNFDGQTVNFTVGQVVTGGTSTATGLIVSQTDSGGTGTLNLSTVSQGVSFLDNEPLSDPLGGNGNANGADTGGITDNTNALIRQNGTTLGGSWFALNANVSPGFPIQATATLDFPNVVAQNFQDLTVTVAGAALGDFVTWSRTTTWPATTLSFHAFVSATDTVTLRATNFGAVDVNPTAFAVRICVGKFA